MRHSVQDTVKTITNNGSGNINFDQLLNLTRPTSTSTL
jgi:hypothetical protein